LTNAQIATGAKVANWTAVMGVFTAIYSIVSALTLFAVGFQSYLTYESGNEAREQLRAIFQMTTVQSFFGPATDTGEQVYGFAPIFNNFGTTRADSVSGWASVAYYSKSVPNNVTFDSPKDAVEAPRGIVGPNAPVVYSAAAVKADDVQAALRQEGVIVLWGHLSYFDIYNPKIERSISFCERLTPSKTKEGLVIFAVTPLKPECNKAAT
jgi:hypothetical protein